MPGVGVYVTSGDRAFPMPISLTCIVILSATKDLVGTSTRFFFYRIFWTTLRQGYGVAGQNDNKQTLKTKPVRRTLPLLPKGRNSEE